MIPVVRVVRSPAEGPYHGHMRVVSLLPSATEVLCAIGAEDLLVGRSHECDHPASVADRPMLTAARITSGTSAEIDREVFPVDLTVERLRLIEALEVRGHLNYYYYLFF